MLLKEGFSVDGILLDKTVGLELIIQENTIGELGVDIIKTNILFLKLMALHKNLDILRNKSQWLSSNIILSQ